MRKNAFLILCYLCIHFVSAFGTIIETPRFQEIISHVTPKTLVVLDIDDTLLIPNQTLGSDVWFLHRIKQHEQKGMPRSEAFSKALAEWESIRHLTQVKLVEEGTDKIIANLQAKGVACMGLTTQGLALATRTVEQLKSLNIDLSKSCPSKEDCYFINEHGVLFRHGILFTSGTPKGQALLTLLEKVGYTPEHILFINDKATHLKDVEQAVEAAKLTFTGLRYSYSDKRVSEFRPEIAEVQWKHSSFDRLLSDKEAEALLAH